MTSDANDPWRSGGLPLLNVAATCPATRALGPGWRAVVWMQGCPLNCPGCIAPDWILRRIARLVTPLQLVDELLARPEVGGLTFSGGEPMLQAAGLAAVARLARSRRDLNIICFSGATLESLRARPPGPGVADLLAEVDLLIDGPYIAARNDNRGLRGSINQRFNYLTPRLRSAATELEGGKRRAEIHVLDDAALLVGVPPEGAVPAFERAIAQASGAIPPGTEQSQS